MTLMDAALDYAAQGWPVFPVKPRGKLPLGRLVNHGFKDATTDEATVRRWWKAEPEANIGMPTGIVFDVADFDSDESMKDFDVIARQHDVNLITFPRARTGRGRHVMVRPTGRGNKVNVLPGMDWRGAGGYVLLPTSIHASGQTYEWVLKPNGNLPDAPGWLLEMITKAKTDARDEDAPPSIRWQPGEGLRKVSDAYVRAAVEAELKNVQQAVEGTRNDSLNRAAFSLGQMVGAGWLQRSYAEMELEAAGRVTNLDIDDGEHSVLATIRSGLDAGILKPRETPADRHPSPAVTGAPVTSWTTAAELTARTPEYVEWVIHGIAAAGSITEIVASIKGGKSTFIGHAVRALLYGETFLTAVAGSGDIWWITEERPTSFRRLLERTGLLHEDRVHILMLQEAKVSWPEMAASAVARAKPGDVLIADTIGRLAGLAGDSENDAGDAQKAMAPLEAAAHAGLAVIVGRHARKAGGDSESAGRGSSAWSGVSDIVIQLSKASEGQPATVRKITSVSRFEETPDDVLIQLTENGYQLLGAEGALAYAAAEIVVKRALEEDGEMLQSALFKLKDDDGKAVSTGTVRRVLDGLQKLRRVEKLGRGGHGDPFRWRFRGDSATLPNPVALSAPIQSAKQDFPPMGGILGTQGVLDGDDLPGGAQLRLDAQTETKAGPACLTCGSPTYLRPTMHGNHPWCDACDAWGDQVKAK